MLLTKQGSTPGMVKNKIFKEQGTSNNLNKFTCAFAENRKWIRERKSTGALPSCVRARLLPEMTSDRHKGSRDECKEVYSSLCKMLSYLMPFVNSHVCKLKLL